MEKRFAGKVAFVTGACTGIGQAAAVRLAGDGALVGVNGRPSDDPAETLRRIKDAGGEGFPVLADVRDPAQVKKMVQEVARRGGRLDYVVSNAGINPMLKWDETSVEEFDALSETNFRGTWLVVTEGAKQMIKEGHGGAVCCTSSLSAHVGSPTQVAYCGTKGGVSMLVKALGDVCDSAPFKTSPRSCEFLRHIVHRSIAGEVDELKERLIGMSLLGREATYDTGSDADVVYGRTMFASV